MNAKGKLDPLKWLAFLGGLTDRQYPRAHAAWIETCRGVILPGATYYDARAEDAEIACPEASFDPDAPTDAIED